MTTIHHVWHKRQRYALNTQQVIALLLSGVSRCDLYLTAATRNERTETTKREIILCQTNPSTFQN